MQAKDQTLIRMREEQLIKSYDRAIGELGEMAAHLTKKFIICKALSYPTPRFYISEEQAMTALNYFRRHGKHNPKYYRKNREQIEEIMERYRSAKSADVFKADVDIMSDIVHSEAPKMYITPESAYMILYYKITNAR